jgi:hypothetical protein
LPLASSLCFIYIVLGRRRDKARGRQPPARRGLRRRPPTRRAGNFNDDVFNGRGVNAATSTLVYARMVLARTFEKPMCAWLCQCTFAYDRTAVVCASSLRLGVCLGASSGYSLFNRLMKSPSTRLKVKSYNASLKKNALRALCCPRRRLARARRVVAPKRRTLLVQL